MRLDDATTPGDDTTTPDDEDAREPERTTVIGPGGEGKSVTAEEHALLVRGGDEGGDGIDVDRMNKLRATKRDTASQLERLARRAEDEPLFAGEREVDWIDLPGGHGRFLPRPLTTLEVREWRSVTGGQPKVFMDEIDPERIDHMQTNVNTAGGYAYLTERGIAEYELNRANDEVEKTASGAKQRREVLGQLTPAVAEWLELFLQQFNGLLREQEEAEDFS